MVSEIGAQIVGWVLIAMATAYISWDTARNQRRQR